MRIHDHIERGLSRLARGAAGHAWLVSIAALLVAGGLAARIPEMQIESSAESYLDPGSSARVAYDGLRETFGRDDVAVIVVEAPDVFSLDTLRRLRALHRDVEASAPHVDETISLVNARDTREQDGLLVVDALMADWPETVAQVEVLRQRVEANPLYHDILISSDRRLTAVLVRPLAFVEAAGDDVLDGFGEDAAASAGPREQLPTDDIRELVGVLEQVVDRHTRDDFRLYLAGSPVITAQITQSLELDSARFTGISAAAVAVLLFLVFRRTSGVILPLIVVGCAVAATQGLMVVLGIPLSTPLEIIPPLLLTVGTCSAVHVIAIFYQRLAAGDARIDAIEAAMAHSGPGVLMASVTTAFGLLSFVTAELAPVANVGLVAPVGVLLTLAYTLLLLPALLAIVPIQRAGRPTGSLRVLARALGRVGAFSAGHPRLVLGTTVLLLAVGAVGVSQLRFAMHWLSWLPESDPVREAALLVNEEFRGAGPVEVVLDTGRAGRLKEPEMLDRIERAMRAAETIAMDDVAIGKTISIVDILEETHAALVPEVASMQPLPATREGVAQEVLLFESAGSDDLEAFVDPTYRYARISMRVPDTDAVHYIPVLGRLREEMRATLGPDVDFEVTGLITLLAESFTAIIRSLARSYVFALAVITPTMVLLIGNVRRGLLSMLPNVIPVFAVLGLMGWLDLPLDLASLLLGSIILGLAVDDTIHFFYRFERSMQATGGDVERSIQRTLATTGVALLTTSIVLSVGFLSFTFAYMQNMVTFGLLSAFAVAAAFVSDLVVGPALVVWTTGRRARNRRSVIDMEPRLDAAS